MPIEVSGPPLLNRSDDGTLVARLRAELAAHPDRPVFSVRVGSAFVDRSATEVWDRIIGLARGLVATGIQPGDRVALMSATRAEWLELDLAIAVIGAISVPIYETSSAGQIGWILTDSEARLLIVETAAMLDSARTGAEGRTEPEILTIDSGGLDELAARGVEVEPSEVLERLDRVGGDDVATLIYTSGTTGRPKGCVLTHANLLVNVDQITEAMGDTIDASDTVLLFLPLAHVLTRTTALYCLATGVRIAFGTSIANLPEEFAIVRPTLIAAVPRIFEKVFARAQHTADTDGKGRIFERAATTAIAWSRQREAGRIGRLTAVEHRLFERLVYGKLAAAFGGRLRMAFSGGGPLGERLTSFFDGIGVRVYEGYGLTETSPLVTINRTDAWRPGSVGRAVARTSIRIDADGEVLVRGPQVFRGYWHNEAATAEAFDDDGWFHTGDIGTVDMDGYLHITGRKKDLIVTSAGKNVAPAPLEDLLRAHPLVSQAMVVGDARRFIAALVTIDADAFADWAPEHGYPGATVVDLATTEALRREIQEAVDRANASVSRAESIREFVILPHDFSLDRGEITPTLKVRRDVVAEHHRHTIESIYRERDRESAERR